MNDVLIKCSWIQGDMILQSKKMAQISLVAYEHYDGMPARFWAGLIPAVALYRQLSEIGISSIVRIVDPTPIAYYCNGWSKRESMLSNVISDFMRGQHVDFFFDQSEQVSSDTLDILQQIGQELERSLDPTIIDMVGRIKESGRKHGGELGIKNSILYMAAHPFSWLTMHHPLVWKQRYDPSEYQFINLMSQPESRFTLIRKFLQERRPDLLSGIIPLECYMVGCNTPCYIPLEGEPSLTDLVEQGYEWCHKRYKILKGQTGNHRRALKDFESIISFLGTENI